MKDKKCIVCGELFKPFRTTARACSAKCAIEYGIRQTAKREKKKVSEYKAELRAMKRAEKEKLKKYSKRVSEAKVIFQKYIRLRDANQPCISCGTYVCDEWAGGHFYPAGHYSGLIFDERNCHKQCNQYCNKHLNGNPHGYRKGLIQRFGNDYVKQLDEDAILQRKRKYTDLELLEIKTRYRMKIKGLIQ